MTIKKLFLEPEWAMNIDSRDHKEERKNCFSQIKLVGEHL